MQTIYSALKFDKGITPKVYTKDSATRIEHFDTITEVLRPFRTLISSPHNQGGGVTIGQLALINFDILNDVLYAVGTDHATPTTGAIYKWDTTAFEWQSKQSFGGTLVPDAVLQAHASYLFGIVNGNTLYRFSPPSTLSMSFYSLGATYSYFCDPITHSKDGIMYFGSDNVLHKVDSTGATGSVALTLPNANFRITSLDEQGNFINIVGFDYLTGESSSLLWDRDTSVVDLTESVSLGRDIVVHNATLLGTTFFVQHRQNISNTSFAEKPMLIIKYMNGNIPTTLYEFPVVTIGATSGLIGGKYTDNERLYFTARIQFDGESTARNVVFCLDYKGRLTIAQNVAIDTGTVLMKGLIRNGEGFWIGAGADGAWNTTTSYATVSAFETNDIRAENLGENIQFIESYITCESLPSGASIVLKARKNTETTFTTLKTFDTDGQTKLKLTSLEAVNALNGLDGARQVRFRIESTGGATITGFQAFFTTKPDQGNG